MTPPEAGWYPDPGGSGGRRYWNGHSWTEHVSAPTPPVMPPPQPPPQPQPQPQHPAEPQAPLPSQPTESSPPPAAPEPAPTQVLPGPVEVIGGPRPGAVPPVSGAPPGPAEPTQVMPRPTELPPAPPAPGVGPMGGPVGGPMGPGVYPPAPPPTGWTTATPGMPPVAVTAGLTVGPDGQVLSGWWRRFGGYVIDSILTTIVAAAVVGIVAAVTGGFGEVFATQAWNDLLAELEANPAYQPTQAEFEALIGPGLWPMLAWLTGISLVLSFLNGVLLVMMSGQTIGDRVVGTRKVMPGRRVPGFGPAFVRWVIPALLNLMQALPLIGFAAFAAWLLDYLWPLWDPRNQTLHDKVAGTFVERSALAGPPNP